MSVLEFDQMLSLSLSLSLFSFSLSLSLSPSLSLSLSGFTWHVFLVLSNLRYQKISVALQRSPDITMHNDTSKRNTHTHTHTHTYMQTRRQHTEHHLRTSFAGLVVSASALDLTIPSKPTTCSLLAT